MYKVKAVWLIALSNFRKWKKNPQIILAFCLGFILCFLLSDKVISFAQDKGIVMQALEPFIWTFGDATSVLIISLLLVLLFSDMPNVGNEVPFMLVRISKKTWMLGQILYMILATVLFTLFLLLSTILLSASMVYTADMWSDTAAVLGYSDIGNNIFVPSFVKVMELSLPSECAINVFLLITGYAVFMASIILFFNLFKNKGGVIAAIIFSGFGFLLTPDIIAQWLKIPAEQMAMANIYFGWLSPLNQATYHMHNFGYDNLPKLWQSYVFFGVGIGVLFLLSLIKVRKYNFNFTGTMN